MRADVGSSGAARKQILRSKMIMRSKNSGIVRTSAPRRDTCSTYNWVGVEPRRVLVQVAHLNTAAQQFEIPRQRFRQHVGRLGTTRLGGEDFERALPRGGGDVGQHGVQVVDPLHLAATGLFAATVSEHA